MPDVAASSADALRAPQGGDDAALLAACHAGDARAFATLARRHHPALRALAGCWRRTAPEAERDVAKAWLAVLSRTVSASGASSRGPAAGSGSGAATAGAGAATVRARVGREVVAACVSRTGAALEPMPRAMPDAERFFGPDHELWPGDWADPPRPWGPSAQRRLAQRDVPRTLRRIVRELPIACGAVITLCDLHDWPVSECAFALDQTDAGVRAFLRAGRERVRAALEREADGA
jgi:RNA polymerase sigma-70 factor (ECF subfamily)